LSVDFDVEKVDDLEPNVVFSGDLLRRSVES
jgi:hypothetical protein